MSVFDRTTGHGNGMRALRRLKERRRNQALKASLAEHVANEGSARSWAASNGLSQSYASKIWREICADLGAQAV
jgi:hypothetical protein